MVIRQRSKQGFPTNQDKFFSKLRSMAQRSKRGGGRDRTASAQFLNNKQFAYLFEKSPNKASSYLPNGAGKSPLAEASDEEDADNNNNSPFITISPPTNSNGNSNNNNSYQQMNKIKNKKKRKSKNIKPRTSSIQVSTTKTENEQLNAIKKEVEFLTSEVPHFREIFLQSQSQFALSKRNKADSEAFALIQGISYFHFILYTQSLSNCYYKN